MGREKFADLERLRTEILKEKAETGISKFKEDSGRQWVDLRFEKPLLEKFLSLIEQAERAQELEGKIVKAIDENGSVGDRKFVVNQILESALEGEE